MNPKAIGRYAVLVLAALFAPGVGAQNTYLVTTTANSGPGSLPAAVAAMVVNGQTQIVRFQLPANSTITLVANLPDLVGSAVEIIGSDSPNLTIDGAGARSIFRYPSGQSLLLRDIALRNGRSSDAGCLSSNAAIATQVFDSRFTSCRTDGVPASGSGGGAISVFGPLRVTRSRFEFNIASDGGIDNLSLGGGAISVNANSLLIEQSTFFGNFTLRTARASGGCFDGSGGAIALTVPAGASATIRDTRFVSNAHRCGTPSGPISGQGGALFILGPASGAAPIVAIDSVHFGGNRADNAAGIFARSVRLNISNTFFHDNAGRGAGALLVTRSTAASALGELSLINTTFWNNATEFTGTGADLTLVANAAVVRQLRNVLFAPSAAGNQCAPQVFNVDAGATSFVAGSDCVAFLPNNDVITTEFAASNTFGLLVPSDRDSVIPILGLSPGSIAIDNGTNALCPARDALGLIRPIDGDASGGATCDVGAIEWRLPLLTNGFDP